MTPIDFLRLQARRLLADLKTLYTAEDGRQLYRPTHFSVNAIVANFQLGHVKEPTLAYAEHVIAVMLGYPSWTALAFTNDKRLELARLRFENQNRYSLAAWPNYMAWFQEANGIRLDAEGETSLFTYMLRGTSEDEKCGYLIRPTE